MLKGMVVKLSYPSKSTLPFYIFSFLTYYLESKRSDIQFKNKSENVPRKLKLMVWDPSPHTLEPDFFFKDKVEWMDFSPENILSNYKKEREAYHNFVVQAPITEDYSGVYKSKLAERTMFRNRLYLPVWKTEDITKRAWHTKGQRWIRVFQNLFNQHLFVFSLAKAKDIYTRPWGKKALMYFDDKDDH